MCKLNEKLIPKGVYCYDEKGICPYFSTIEDEGIKMFYCKYLKKGDTGNITDEQCKILEKKYGSEEAVYKKYPLLFLFDHCKECGVNDNGEGEEI